MIKFYTPLGKIELSNDYFAGLVGTAITSCYGVADMSVAGTTDSLKTLVFGSNIPEKGVVVKEDDGTVAIDLHIKVVFGVNIPTVVDSIKHKVKYVIEEATGLTVSAVNVCVDDIVSE